MDADLLLMKQSLLPMDNIQEECSVRFTLSIYVHCVQMQRVNQNIVVLSTKAIPEVANNNFFIHEIFNLNARAVEEMLGCVAIFILVAVFL